MSPPLYLLFAPSRPRPTREIGSGVGATSFPLGIFAPPLPFAQSYVEDARASLVLNSFAIHKKKHVLGKYYPSRLVTPSTPHLLFLSYVRIRGVFDCCLKWLDEAIPST